MSKTKTGTVYLVGAGPGGEGLLTLRGAELLRRADVVVHDTLLNMALLNHAPTSAQIVPAGKRSASETMSQEEIHQFLIQSAREGKTVVRLKGGDPFVFGRGGEEAQALAAAGIPFEVVPGVSSFSAVPACAGIPLTQRGYASAFTVVTGHEDPEKPGTSVDWTAIARAHGTKVILMGIQRLSEISAALQKGGLPAATPAAVIRWGTTSSQTTIVGTLDDIASKARDADLAAPGILVVGDVVSLRPHLNWYENLPLFSRRIVVTRARDQSAFLTARLTELGAEVLEVPTIRVVPPTERTPMVEALAGLGEYDWVVFSSPRGVTSFFDALLAAFDDIRALGNLRIAAVGPATAERLKHLHIRVDAMPSEFVGRNIAKAIADKESLENLRILLARAQVANPDICRELEEGGAIVDDVAFYQTVGETTDPSGAADRLKTEGADWITFTSGSTVENLHARIDLPALLARHPALRLASIGPETSKALKKLGLTPTVEARIHTLEGLVDALVKAARPESQRAS